MTIEDALPMTAMLAELANVRAELERTKRRLERVTTPEAERDRRVGAAVRKWKGDDNAADFLAVAESLRPEWPRTASLLETIAAALREEAGR